LSQTKLNFVTNPDSKTATEAAELRTVYTD